MPRLHDHDSSDETVTFEATFVREFQKAWLVEVEGEEVIIPLSQIAHSTFVSFEYGEDGEVTIPRWLARNRGLVD